MSEVRLVVAILVPAIFTLILKDFFDLFMTNRYEGKVKQYTIWMLYFLLDTVISMNFKFVGVISMLYSFIILIAFCAVLYRDDIKYITLTVLFIICIGAASELIVALGIRAFLNSSQLQQFSLFGSTCSKLIILIIVRIVKLFRVSGIKRLDYMNWLANVSMTAGSLYIVYNLYLLSLNETKLLGSTMSSIIILLLNVICFKMFDKIAADAEIKRKNDIYKQSIDIYKREMEEREEHNEKLRRFRHDIKNHLIAIEKLALSKEYDRLRDYIHQLTDEKGVLQVTTISGNALIDGLLADKFDVARKYEIAVEYHIGIPTKLPFDDADLCIIVGNALDNAIDGTKDIEGAKKIEISMGFKQGNFLLKVKNTFNPELIKFDNNGKRLRTSKTDKSNHGMGIGLIEETALKYNGLMEITIYFESCGSRVHIVLKGKLYKFYKKLDDVEKEISVNYSIPFIRIHKSYLVNFQQIRKVGYTEVETKDGRILKISDTYKKDVRARYSKLLWDGDV